MNLLKLGRFTIDLLHLWGKVNKLAFQNKILKGLLIIELRKYEGHTLGLTLKDKYKQVKHKRF